VFEGLDKKANGVASGLSDFFMVFLLRGSHSSIRPCHGWQGRESLVFS